MWFTAALCGLLSNVVAEDAPSLEVDRTYGVVYSTVDERELKLDVYRPKTEQAAPAVLVVHGGAWRSGNRQQLAGYANAICARGFVCFAIDYRLAPAHKFPAQIEDCRAAVKWIRQHGSDYGADTDRLGAIGYSAGGHLVSLLGTTGAAPGKENDNVDTRLDVVVAGGAPTDFRVFPDNGEWARYWMGGNLTEVPDKFKAASANAFVDKDDPPMFFFNGTQDELVPLAWSQSLHTNLKQAGIRTELHKIEGAGHMAAAINQKALLKGYDFLESVLKPDVAR